MDGAFGHVVVFGFLVLCSAFFAGSETALFSLGRVGLLRLREAGHPRAALLQYLLSDPRRLIATIFIGNELVNIGASAVAASLVDATFHALGPLVVTLISTLLSVTLIVLFGEITPKNVAVQLGDRWATAAARPLEAMANLVAPIRWGIERIADATVELVGPTSASTPAGAGVSEAQYRELIDRAGAEGQLDAGERALISRTLELGARTAAQVMTPAERVFALPVTLSLPRMIEEVKKRVHSRIPIYEGARDRIVGVLLAKELLESARPGPGGTRRPLRELLRAPLFVPRSAKCDWLLREFQRTRVHLAIVVDEYGKLLGLVSLEDILEQVFGPIADEKERLRSEAASGAAGVVPATDRAGAAAVDGAPAARPEGDAA